jgi:hypothetical protein
VNGKIGPVISYVVHVFSSVFLLLLEIERKIEKELKVVGGKGKKE